MVRGSGTTDEIIAARQAIRPWRVFRLVGILRVVDCRGSPLEDMREIIGHSRASVVRYVEISVQQEQAITPK